MIEYVVEKSFFEHLRIADVERIHSEFISWIFSSDCEAIKEEEKCIFLNEVFKLSNTKKIKNIGTEIDNVDIFIETNNSVLIIENKIKSSQHSDQLNRYKNHVENLYPEKNHKFIYLTLVKEQFVDKEWIHISYFDIFNGLQKLNLIKHRHSVFVEDYILYLKRLLAILNEVTFDTIKYESVFINGGLKKSEKININYTDAKERFIAKNQLETIFQKAFLTQLLQAKELLKYNGVLTDTRGTALIDFPLSRNININDSRLYTTFIQIQGDNIKFAFAVQEGYSKSKKKWIASIVDIFKELKSKNIHGFKRINSPKSKAYVSISKKMEKPYWHMKMKEIQSMIINEIKLGQDLSEKLVREIKNTVGNTRS